MVSGIEVCDAWRRVWGTWREHGTYQTNRYLQEYEIPMRLATDFHRTISTYVNERSLPAQESVKKIARALRVRGDDLLPEGAMTDRQNSLTITADGMGGLLEARIHCVPMDVLSQVVELLRPYVVDT